MASSSSSHNRTSSNGSTPSTTNSTGTGNGSVPRVGGVRCYWALVAPRFPSRPGSKLELVFVHPDPVLAVHLARQKVSMMGRGVIEFIHPAEREQARRDLGSAIAVDDLQGSVTRLSRIRTILGCPPEENDVPFDAATFVEDDEYLILDLVLNWVADGLLLAFFHAIKDKDSTKNNDPTRKDEEWSNFCGTAHMPDDQIEALHTNILHNIPMPLPQADPYPPLRVFQLHAASEAGQPSRLVFTWPPAKNGPSPRYDGTYDAEEYANLMKGVNMDPSQLSAVDDTRTNCTSRFGAKHSVTSDNMIRHVHSVFIPYGSLIFACFQTTYVQVLPREAPQIPLQQYVDQSADWSSGFPQPVPPPWDGRGERFLAERYDDRMYQTPQPHQIAQVHQPSPYPSAPPSAPPQQTPIQFHQGYPSPGMPYNEQYNTEPAIVAEMTGAVTSANTSAADQVPPPTGSSGDGNVSGNGIGNGNGSSRPMVKPPGDIEQCAMCGTKTSPEWRRNENGIKDLCNACGLKLARQVAKREGKQKPRKKVKA